MASIFFCRPCHRCFCRLRFCRCCRPRGFLATKKQKQPPPPVKTFFLEKGGPNPNLLRDFSAWAWTFFKKGGGCWDFLIPKMLKTFILLWFGQFSFKCERITKIQTLWVILIRLKFSLKSLSKAFKNTRGGGVVKAHCTVWKTIVEIELRICQPFRGLFNFSLSSTFLPNN